MRAGQGRPRRRRRRSDRRQRRHRQQDRHLQRRGARARAQHSVLRRRAAVDHRPATRPTATHIPIEERNAREVTHVGVVAARRPTGAQIWNPAFDVTPHRFIAGIITERGIFAPPYTRVAAATRSKQRSSRRAVCQQPDRVRMTCDPRHRNLLRRDVGRRRRRNRRRGAAVGDPLERRRLAGRDSSRVGRRRAGARVAPAHSRHLRRRRARARARPASPGAISAPSR